MKYWGLVSARLFSLTGCGEACANSASIIAEMSLALGWNCRQLRSTAWSWTSKGNVDGRADELGMRERRSAMTLSVMETRSICNPTGLPVSKVQRMRLRVRPPKESLYPLRDQALLVVLLENNRVGFFWMGC